MLEEQVVREVIQQFCYTWFVERNFTDTVAFLADDIGFVGTGIGEQARGTIAMQDYIRQDIEQIPEPFQMQLTVIHQIELAEHIWELSTELTLKNTMYAWHLRSVFTVIPKDFEQWKIRTLHISEPSSVQKEGEHYPKTLVMENIARQRQELLNDSLPGGMMGGYIEEGFPFYFINKQMLQHLGYEEEADFVRDIAGLVINCMHPEDRIFVDASVEQQLENSDEYTVEYRMRKRDGSYIWVHDIGRKTIAENGKPAIYSVCIDITENKKHEKRERELYEKELAYFTEISSVKGGMQGRMNITRNRLESYNSTADVVLGQVGDTYDQIVTQLSMSAVDAEYGSILGQKLERSNILKNFREGKTDYSFSFLRKRDNGSSFWGSTNLRLCLNPEDDDVIAFFYTIDDTEKKLQNTLLKRISQLDYDIILDIDLQWGYYQLIAGRQYQNILPEEGVFQTVRQTVAERYVETASLEEFLEKTAFDYMKQQLAEKESYSFITEFIGNADEKRVKRFQIFYISRELHRVGLVCNDVTDVVQKEQQQKEHLATALVAVKQASAAKSEFLSRMSHEIRTPMNAIVGMTAVAKQAAGHDPVVQGCLSKIELSSRFLLSLINDILDMSRIESGKILLKKEEFPMEEFIAGINTICAAQAESKAVEYICIADPLLEDAYVGDAMKLQQVLVNILSNAIKFTAADGRVIFSVVQKRKRNQEAELRFTVQDTGIGIEEAFLPHLFEPFSQESTGTTATYSGTGLGLAISKNIMDLMNGKITVHSIKGVGTEFLIDVPLKIAKQKPHSAMHQHQRQFSGLKTLVVDDDVLVCESISAALRELGMQTEWVDNGLKAVQLVQMGHQYDILLIDWKMPEQNGIATVKEIRKTIGATAVIILMTAYDWNLIEQEAKQAGVDLLLSKPIFKSSLSTALCRIFDEREKAAVRQKEIVYDFTGKRILLVEDNPLNVEVAALLLESKGAEVQVAENGLRALEQYGHSEAGYYDAILMDIRMPLMDGLTAASGIRHLSNEDAADIPIIAMTANAFEDDMEKSREAGMNAHLTKPIDPEQLYQTLYHYFEKTN